jgi:hypothetical protein
MRTRNLAVFSAMGVSIIALMIAGGWSLGQSMLVAGGVATAFLLIWNVVWVNTVLFQITKDAVNSGK